MDGESKGFEYKPKKPGNRIYSGAYGNGLVVSINNKVSKKRVMMLDGKKRYFPNPMLNIKFDNHRDIIEQLDSSVGLIT